ncbi:hypothetical protein NJB93_19755 [Brucella intermedia]|uniref:hypothetical protein n=1 Tax=Brucella intermedia TaxID=94625 RepID=UPI00209BB9A0|nr:hypothetical protein [Brucella intermedia]MCO7728818.1 hypothetical protein [Brucella intermedia]
MNALAHDIEDEIDLVITYYGGDTRAAIKALLEDREFLAQQIAIASMAVSQGYTRGWKPTVFVK